MTRLTSSGLPPSQALQAGGASWRETATRLAERFDVAAGPARQVRRLLLDDASWHLAANGLALEAVADVDASGADGRWRLRLRQIGSVAAARGRAPQGAANIGEPLEASVATLPLVPANPRSVLPPAFARGLPARVDALEIKAEAQLRLREVSLRDGLAKTVVHLDWWEAKGPAAAAWLETRPVRGYHDERRRLVAALGWTPALAAPGVDGFFRLASLAAPAAALPIPAASPAAYCVAVLVRRELDLMQAELPGVFADAEPECLHRFRVASRRVRSLLRVAKRVVPRAASRRAASFLRWLNGVSGPVRDRHVLLDEWSELVSDMAPREAAGGARLKARIEREQVALGGALFAALRGDRYARGIAHIAAMCDDMACWGTQRALQDAQVLASSRIARSFEGFVAEGQRISEASPAEALHDLRKTGKQLRYVLELLGPQASGDRSRARPLIKRLKKLQDVLGTFQDQTARADLLAATVRAGKARDKQADEDDTLRALNLTFEATAVASRAAFAAAFAEFCAKRCHADIAALIRPSSGQRGRSR